MDMGGGIITLRIIKTSSSVAPLPTIKDSERHCHWRISLEVEINRGIFWTSLLSFEIFYFSLITLNGEDFEAIYTYVHTWWLGNEETGWMIQDPNYLLDQILPDKFPSHPESLNLNGHFPFHEQILGVSFSCPLLPVTTRGWSQVALWAERELGEDRYGWGEDMERM